MDAERVQRIAKALADPRRREILEWVAQTDDPGGLACAILVELLRGTLSAALVSPRRVLRRWFFSPWFFSLRMAPLSSRAGPERGRRLHRAVIR
jgi:DNA-binding transcriptional ArsR family regulator